MISFKKHEKKKVWMAKLISEKGNLSIRKNSQHEEKNYIII